MLSNLNLADFSGLGDPRHARSAGATQALLRAIVFRMQGYRMARLSTNDAISRDELLPTTLDSVPAATRGAASTHAGTSAAEIRNLKRYVEGLLAELLEIS